MGSDSSKFQTICGKFEEIAHRCQIRGTTNPNGKMAGKIPALNRDVFFRPRPPGKSRGAWLDVDFTHPIAQCFCGRRTRLGRVRDGRKG